MRPDMPSNMGTSDCIHCSFALKLHWGLRTYIENGPISCCYFGPPVQENSPKPKTGRGGAKRALRAFRERHSDTEPQAALAALRAEDEAYRSHPDWQAEHSRLLRVSGELAQAEALIAPLANGGAPGIIAEYGAVLAAQGRVDEAIKLVGTTLDHTPDHQRLSGLWLRLLKRSKGRDVALAIATGRLRSTEWRPGDRVMAELSDGLIKEAAPAAAHGLTNRVWIAGREASAVQNLAKARAAAENGDMGLAREALARAIVQLTPEGNLNKVRDTLASVVLPDRPPAVSLQVLHHLQTHMATIARNLAISAEDFEAIASGKMIEEAGDGVSPDALVPKFHTLADMNRLEELREALRRTEDIERLSPMALKAIIRIAYTANDPRLLAQLSARALQHEEHSWPEAAVEALLAREERGELHAEFAFYLCAKGPQLAELITDDHQRTAFAGLLGKAPSILKGLGQVGLILRERQMATHFMRAFGRAPDALASIITPVHRGKDLDRLRENLLAQNWPQIEAIILPNGPLAGSTEVEDKLGDLPFVRIVRSDKTTIGGLLNDGIDAAQGDYVLRFDSDDIYLSDYVTNMVSLLHGTGADHCAKPALFVYIEAADFVVLQDSGTSFSRIIGGCGGSQAFRAGILKKHRFSETLVRSEDIQICRQIMNDGGLVISAPPFDFIQVRHADKGRHTWQLDDAFLHGTRYFIGPGSIIPALGNPVFE